jgi:hypothetical protein
MATIHRFEDLEIWQLARKLYQKISKLAEKIKKIMIIVLPTR